MELRAFSSFQDVYGNIKDEVAIKFTISKETAAKINWGNVDPRSFGRILSGQSCSGD